MFPFDVVALLEAELAKNQRPPDGKLHASSHLTGSLRHIMLDMAGAPHGGDGLGEDTASQINLAVGTAIHALMENAMRGQLVMLECKLDRWLPEGWSGTADWVAWDADRRCFVLGDLKTQKSGSLHYILSGGAKEAHILQVSAYYHALVDAGLPMLNGAIVAYVPKSQLSASEGKPVHPSIQEVTPLPREVVHARMAAIGDQVGAYLASVDAKSGGLAPHAWTIDTFLTDALAPVAEREVRLSLNKANKRPVIDVKLVPNWETSYCQFPDELCNCRHQTANKIGSWDRDDSGQLVYTPLPKAPQPTAHIMSPGPSLINALVKAQKEKADAA